MTIADEQILNRPIQATKSKSITIPVSTARVDKKCYTVVVLGVERGGTSMVAGVVRAAGINMGEVVGLNHEDPVFIQDDQDRLKAHIKQRNAKHDVWGFKMPKMAFQLDFCEKELRNPVYIVAYRNPLSIADSWIQRGTGELKGVLQRVQLYQEALNKFYETSTSPILLVNYERAVKDEDARADFVSQIAEFLELKLDDETRARAMSMMTNDGGGYLNLPEQYFAVVQRHDHPPEGKPIALLEDEPNPRDDESWIRQSRMSPSLVLRMADGSNLPKRFRLRLNFKHGVGTSSPSASLRLFFRYTGRFVNEHCYKLVLKDGQNVLDVETSGLADRIAFGPWELPCSYKMEVTAEVLSGDVKLDGSLAAAETRRPKARPSLPSRILGKLRRMMSDRSRSGI